MRFRSRTAAAGRVYAVTGTNTVSFAVVASDVTKAGLLGFAVRRYDLAAGTDEWMPGFKVFHTLVPNPLPGQRVSTYDQPVQSFTWDDFTCQPGSRYRYVFHPLKGTPEKLVRSATPLTLTIRTEPLYGEQHDVFFNRGVASSQSYTAQYGNTPIADLDPDRQKQALGWLSRDLDDALLRFIDQTQPGDRLLGCFYEFAYDPAATALKNAIDRGGRRPARRGREGERVRDRGLVPAPGEPRHPGPGWHHDRPLPAPRGETVGHRPQQVHGAHPRGFGTDAGVDRVDEPHARRDRGADQRRALGARPLRGAGLPGLLEPAGG